MKTVYVIENNTIVNVIVVEDSFVCDNITKFEVIPEGTLDPQHFAPSGVI